jgi:cytochrome c5
MLGLTLALVLAAPTSARLLYEQKCLYCHSEEVTERRRRTVDEWRRLVEEMRRKAPLLVTRSDAAVLSRFLARLLPATPPVKPAPGPRPAVVTSTPPPPPPVPVEEADPTAGLEAWPGVAGATAEDLERARATEQAGFTLMERRCSRCHTLGRVYGKLDSRDRSMAIIERMRVKTGSGITDGDLRVLKEFVRAQFVE